MYFLAVLINIDNFMRQKYNKVCIFTKKIYNKLSPKLLFRIPINFINMNIIKLAELLKASSLNKLQVAERCGISRTTLDNVLSGADAKISTIEALAKVLGVKVGYFFDEEVGTSIVQSAMNGNNASNRGKIEFGDISVSDNSSILKERVSLLEKLLEEKERTIQILMNNDK